jgi:hypothetical protein
VIAYRVKKMLKLSLCVAYGAKDHIDHPDTARRVAEIEALKQQRDGADRFALQEKLLPKCFRGRNERTDERMERRGTPSTPSDLRAG